ncbi:MAG: POTRA domain-containing protein [Chitinophagaceae bacterium]
MRLLIFICLGLLFTKVAAQNVTNTAVDSTVIISHIIVSGNKHTKTNIILREIFFKEGDTITIKDLAQKIIESKSFIFNTTLFVEVNIETAKLDGNKIAVLVLVKERWYIFPLPYFKLVDRNFNEWWVNQNHSFERVNYGMKFYHNNLSGNNDKLNIWLITGYNRQVTVRYELPLANKKLTNGFNVGITNSKQKEVNYATGLNNKQLFFKLQDGFAKNFTRFDFTFTNRPDKKVKHSFRLAYTIESIADSVVIKNPNYYLNQQNKFNYVDFTYSLQYLNSNYNAYPTNGFSGNLSLYHRGIFDKESDFTQLTANTIIAFPFFKKWFFRARNAATIKFPYNNQFINQPIFGYGDFQLRGQEYYVVDGMAGLMSKMNIGKDLFTFNVKLPVKGSTYNKIPVKVYGKFYGDFGYSYNPYVNNNLLNNKLMYTYGLGLDIVTIYDVVIKLEYSFNQLGDKGFFFGN